MQTEPRRPPSRPNAPPKRRSQKRRAGSRPIRARNTAGISGTGNFSADARFRPAVRARASHSRAASRGLSLRLYDSVGRASEDYRDRCDRPRRERSYDPHPTTFSGAVAMERSTIRQTLCASFSVAPHTSDARRGNRSCRGRRSRDRVWTLSRAGRATSPHPNRRSRTRPRTRRGGEARSPSRTKGRASGHSGPSSQPRALRDPHTRRRSTRRDASVVARRSR